MTQTQLMARIAYISVLLFLSGCGIGLRVFDPHLTTTFPTSFVTGYCYEISLISADRNNEDAPVERQQPIEIALESDDGWLRFHASQSDCELNLRALNSLSIPTGGTSVTTWVKAYVPQTQTVRFTASALNYGSLEHTATVEGTPFDRTEGFNGSVLKVRPALAGDGKVYVAGQFNRHGSLPLPGLARLDADGNLDTSFTLTFTASSGGYLNDVLEVGDGSGDFLIGGAFTSINEMTANRIVRLNPDGTTDASFSAGTGFDNLVESIEAVGDGSGDVYVAGSFTNYNGSAANRIARLRPDGSMAPGFNPGVGFDAAVMGAALAPDGSHDLYLIGDFLNYAGGSSAYIARITPTGAVAPGFTVGIGFNGSTRAIAVAQDGTGDIIVGGNFTTFKGSGRVRLARINSAGTLTAFAVGAGANGTVRAAYGDSAGRVYAGGDFTTYQGSSINRIVRLLGTGAVDTDFVYGNGLDASAQAMELNVDGRLHVAGDFSIYHLTGTNRHVTLLPSGAINPLQKTGTMFNANVAAVVPGNGGTVYASGNFTRYNGSSSNYLIRLKSDGTADPSFSIGTGLNNAVYAAWPQSNGGILISGVFTQLNGASLPLFGRVNSDGTIDGTFNCSQGGTVFSAVPLVDGSGDFYIGGTFGTINGTTRNGMARINSDGSVDAQFTGSGLGTNVNAISPTASGTTYVGGTFSTFNGVGNNRLVRLNSDGSTDPTFNVGSGFDSTVNAIVQADDGSGDIYVGGTFTTYRGNSASRLIRLNSDGSPDETFNVGSGFDANVSALLATNDGSGGVYVGGAFLTYNGIQTLRITKLLADGTHDWNFYSIKGINGNVSSLARVPDPSGKILVGGAFTQFRLISADRIARIDPVWGSADETP